MKERERMKERMKERYTTERNGEIYRESRESEGVEIEGDSFVLLTTHALAERLGGV